MREFSVIVILQVIQLVSKRLQRVSQFTIYFHFIIAISNVFSESSIREHVVV